MVSAMGKRSALIGLAAAMTGLSWTGVDIAVAAPPKCGDIDGVQVGNVCQVKATDPGYTVDMSVSTLFANQRPVFDYVKQTRDGFLNLARNSDARTSPYVLETKSTEYNSSVPPRGTQSIVLETYEWVGGAHPTTFYKAFNWDQGYRKPITIETLFREGADPFPVIFPLVQAAVTEQFGQEVTFPEHLGLNPETYQNFALTNDELIFFFDRGSVLPEAAGNFSTAIPRQAVAGMLA